MIDDDAGRRIDAGLVDMLWVELGIRYRTRRCRKRDSWLMRTVARVLAWRGVMPQDRFLDGFVTTVGRTIYMPDNGKSGRDLLWEVATCVHEHDHVRRWGIRFMWRYLTDRLWRARYEALAYSTNIAMRYWYAGDWLDIRKLAEKLSSNYGCDDAGVELAYQIFEDEKERLRLGGVTNLVVEQALTFMRERGVSPSSKWPRMDL